MSDLRADLIQRLRTAAQILTAIDLNGEPISRVSRLLYDASDALEALEKELAELKDDLENQRYEWKERRDGE